MATTVLKTVGTFETLRDHNFRVYFIGQLASTSGTWMQITAQGWLVYHLTQSAAWLGIVACAAGLPILLLSPIAGVIVERHSRRQTMMITQTIQMILAFVLAVLVFTHTVQIWHIVVLAVLLGVSNAFDGTVRFAIIADLVEREHLRSAITINAILFNASRVLGPATAGLVLVTFGAGWCFFLNGLSFVPVLISLMLVTVKGLVAPTTTANPRQELAEGLRYARSHHLILPALLLTANAGLLAVSVIYLFPAFAAVVLHSPTNGYTAISIANGFGGVLGGLLMGWFTRRIGLARIIAAMAVLTALSMALFAFTLTIAVSALFAFVLGLAIVVQFIGASTLIQSKVPDAFRGRVLALYNLGFSGLTPFGALTLGLISANIGIVHTFVLTAGVSGILSLSILLRWSNMWKH
jgi:MFS family permease